MLPVPIPSALNDPEVMTPGVSVTNDIRLREFSRMPRMSFSPTTCLPEAGRPALEQRRLGDHRYALGHLAHLERHPASHRDGDWLLNKCLEAGERHGNPILAGLDGRDQVDPALVDHQPLRNTGGEVRQDHPGLGNHPSGSFAEQARELTAKGLGRQLDAQQRPQHMPSHNPVLRDVSTKAPIRKVLYR